MRLVPDRPKSNNKLALQLHTNGLDSVLDSEAAARGEHAPGQWPRKWAEISPVDQSVIIAMGIATGGIAA